MRSTDTNAYDNLFTVTKCNFRLFGGVPTSAGTPFFAPFHTACRRASFVGCYHSRGLAVCLPMFRILLYFFPDVATMMFPRRGCCDTSLAWRWLRYFALFANGKNILNMSVVAVIGLKITPSEEKNALREQKNVHLFCRFIFVSYFCAALSGKYAVVAQW